MKQNKRERGNILFLILLAVVLFAALNFAVNNAMRGGEGKSASSESAQAQAANILNYATLVENETQRLMLAGGFAYNQINFYNNNTHYVSSGAMGPLKQTNPNCTALTGQQCAIFQEAGGGIPSRNFFSESEMDNFYTNGHPYPGEATVFSQFVENVGTTAPDIVLYVADVKDEICDAINRQLGLPTATSQPSIAWNTAGQRHYWTDATDYSGRLPGTATAFSGQRTFCVRHSTYDTLFVHVLIAR